MSCTPDSYVAGGSGFGHAVSLTSAGQQISFTNEDQFYLRDNFYIEFFGTMGGDCYIIKQGSAQGDANVKTFYVAGNTLYAGDNPNWTELAVANFFTIGERHHYAIQKTNSKIVAWRDGVIVGSADLSNKFSGPASSLSVDLFYSAGAVSKVVDEILISKAMFRNMSSNFTVPSSPYTSTPGNLVNLTSVLDSNNSNVDGSHAYSNSPGVPGIPAGAVALFHLDGDWIDALGNFTLADQHWLFVASADGFDRALAPAANSTMGIVSQGILLPGAAFFLEWRQKGPASTFSTPLAIMSGHDNGLSWNIGFKPDGHGRVSAGLVGADVPVIDLGLLIASDNNWHTYAIGRDAGGMCRAFRDGVIQGSGSFATAFSNYSQTSTNWVCGSTPPGQPGALIDEILFIDGSAYKTANYTPETAPYSGASSPDTPNMFNHVIWPGYFGDGPSGGKGILYDGTWVAYKFPTATIINKYQIAGNPDGVQYYTNNLKSWTLSGSNNSTDGSDGTWTTLDIQTNTPLSIWGDGTTCGSYPWSASFDNSTAYSMYKLVCVASHSSSYAGIGEILLGNSLSSYSADASTILHCPFDSDATDQSLESRSTTLLGSSVISTSVKHVGAGSLNVNGVNGGVSVDMTHYTFGAKSYTIDFWMYSTNIVSLGFLFEANNSGQNPKFSIMTGQGNNSVYVAAQNGTPTFAITGNTPLQSNQWYHIALVDNHTDLRLFINGVLDTVHTGTQLKDVYAGAFANFKIGNSTADSPGNYPFPGYIDSFRVSDTALWDSSFTPPMAPYYSPISVIYDGNGSTGGTVPVDSNVYSENDIATVLDNTGPLIKANYTFSHWNTAANGSGTSYIPGDTFNISGNTTLYAQWSATLIDSNTEFLLHFDNNIIDSLSKYTLTAVTTSPTYVSGKFGNGIQNCTVQVTGTENLNITGDFCLEFWAKNPAEDYKMIFGKMWHYGHHWYMSTLTNGAIAIYGQAPPHLDTTVTGYLINDNNFHLYAISREGTTFRFFRDGIIIQEITASVNLVGNSNDHLVSFMGDSGTDTPVSKFTNAIFDEALFVNGAAYRTTNFIPPQIPYTVPAPAPTYSVTYEGNGSTGGTVPTDSNSYHTSDTVTVLGLNTLVKTGYTFVHWNTVANGSGTSYNPSATFAMGSSNVTLYAIWYKNSTTILTGTFAQSKGTPYDLTLSATSLAALAPVAADDYYVDYSNWEKVLFIYKHADGEGGKTIVFTNNGSNAFGDATVKFTSRSRTGVWSLNGILLIDYDGGEFLVSGSNLPSGLTITVS